MTETKTDGQGEESRAFPFVRYCVMCGKAFRASSPEAILCRVWGDSPCSEKHYQETHDEDGELLYPDE